MGSVNRVWLMGWVACPPVVEDGRCRLVVATRVGEHIERQVVVVPEGLVDRTAEFKTGDVAYVEGRLGSRVIAEDLWRVEVAAPYEASAGLAARTHASPRPHERRGHWRRVGLGTPAERLVWVRACAVGLDNVPPLDARLKPAENAILPAPAAHGLVADAEVARDVRNPSPTCDQG